MSDGTKTTGTLGLELFNMPNLERLHLSYEGVCNVVHYEDYSTTAFWQAILSNDVTTMQFVLPKLKSLTISNDPLMSEDAIIEYLEMRSLLGQTPFEELHIDLAVLHSCHTDRLEALQQIMPGLIYRDYEEWSPKHWRQESTRWSLLTELEGSHLDWELLETIRGRLRRLSLYICKWEDDDRLQYELFNRPQLEELGLTFSKEISDFASVAALWNVVLNDTTGKDGVLMQDILPNLRKVYVQDDAMLDEERIIKFVEMRECLGFAPLDRFSGYLKPRNSKNTSRLKSLYKSMPEDGFSFTM
jgi:hypothetical protein